MEEQRRLELNALEPPIRAVPWSLKVALLLGGPLGVFSWAVLALALVFLIPLDWSNILTRTVPMALSETRVVEARVVRTKPLSHNKMVRCDYEYQVAGKKYNSYSYTAKHDAMVKQVQHGHMVMVWATYSVDDPNLSHLQGQVLSWTSWTYFLFFICGALFALVLVVGNIFAGLGEVQLLRRGLLTFGTYVRMVPLNPDLEDSLPQYIFQYSVHGSTYEVSAETDDPSRILDETEEPLFYHPKTPERAIVFDHLPGHPGVRDGRLIVDPKQMVLAIVFPLIVLIELVLFAWW